MSEEVIRLEGLTKTFRKQHVLDGLDLSIKQRERIALIGSNGAGKTTMIRCILGQYGYGGKVRVSGYDPRQHRYEVLRRIGFVPQTPPPLRIPVSELLRFAANLAGVEASRMWHIAVAMGLDMDEAKHKSFAKLSGGQKQKLLIGIALGRDAELLIFDEPTANLDPAARLTLFDLLAQRLDRVMIISSHRLEEVAPLVNRVVEMDRGRVVLDDRIEDMVSSALHQSCQLSINHPDQAFAKLIREWGFESVDGLKWHGKVAAPDRLKFLSVISRYAASLSSICLNKE